MKRILVFLISLILLINHLSYNQVSGYEYDKISEKVKLKERSVTVTIHYFAGNKDWAEHVLDLTVKALPILEEVVGFPYPHRYDVEIWERTSKQLKTDCDVKEEGRECNKGEKGIYIWKESLDSTIIHENAHFWASRMLFNTNWMVEGLAVFFEIEAMKQIFGKKKAKKESVWIDKFKSYDKDFPLSGWGAKTHDVSYGYAKAFGFFYCFSKIYGLSTLQKALFWIYEKERKVNEELFMEYLRKATGEDMDQFFSGWIFEGPYYYDGEIVTRNWFFGDHDEDGILNLDEKGFGTNPKKGDTDGDGLKDGEELEEGTNPLKRDTDDDGLSDGREIEIGTNPFVPDTDRDGILDGKDPHPSEHENVWRKRITEEANDQFSDGIVAFENEEYSKASYFFTLAKQKFEEISPQEKIEECENYLNQIEQKIKEQEEDLKKELKKEQSQNLQEKEARLKTMTIILGFLVFIFIFRRNSQ